MSNDRSREALGRFLDFLGEKGLMSPSTAKTRKVSALKLLEILDAEEASDVTKIDVDDLMRRFNNLHGQQYNPDSVLAYRSRLRSALNDFRSHLQNPLSFKPAIQGRERSSQNRKGASEELKATPEQKVQPQSANATPVLNGTNVMPIPIRANLTILIHGLPHDLSAAEAKRISGVINALALEPD